VAVGQSFATGASQRGGRAAIHAAGLVNAMNVAQSVMTPLIRGIICTIQIINLYAVGL